VPAIRSRGAFERPDWVPRVTRRDPQASMGAAGELPVKVPRQTRRYGCSMNLLTTTTYGAPATADRGSIAAVRNQLNRGNLSARGPSALLSSGVSSRRPVPVRM
jgi:hypothetical protein